MYALGHNILYSYNKQGAYIINISISALLMDKRAKIDGKAYADAEVFSLHSLDIAFSQKMCIPCP